MADLKQKPEEVLRFQRKRLPKYQIINDFAKNIIATIASVDKMRYNQNAFFVWRAAINLSMESCEIINGYIA